MTEQPSWWEESLLTEKDEEALLAVFLKIWKALGSIGRDESVSPEAI